MNLLIQQTSVMVRLSLPLIIHNATLFCPVCKISDPIQKTVNNKSIECSDLKQSDIHTVNPPYLQS